MTPFARAFALVGLILSIHGSAIALGLYGSQKWIDIPMHYFGGVAMGLLALALWGAVVQSLSFQSRATPLIKFLTNALIILGFVALVGVAWEWYEFIFDVFASQVSVEFRPQQMSLGDTMADLFFDLLGGLTAFLAFRKR